MWNLRNDLYLSNITVSQEVCGMILAFWLLPNIEALEIVLDRLCRVRYDKMNFFRPWREMHSFSISRLYSMILLTFYFLMSA